MMVVTENQAEMTNLMYESSLKQSIENPKEFEYFVPLVGLAEDSWVKNGGNQNDVIACYNRNPVKFEEMISEGAKEFFEKSEKIVLKDRDINTYFDI